jgi:hypothetical protein
MKGVLSTPVNRTCINCKKKFQTVYDRKILCSIDCRKERNKKIRREWYLENRQYVIAYVTAWKKNNPEKPKSYYRKSFEKDPERFRKWNREYRKQHPEQMRLSNKKWYIKNSELINELRKISRQKHKLANEILRSIDPSISLGTSGSIRFLEALGINIDKIMENIDVD